MPSTKISPDASQVSESDPLIVTVAITILGPLIGTVIYELYTVILFTADWFRGSLTSEQVFSTANGILSTFMIFFLFSYLTFGIPALVTGVVTGFLVSVRVRPGYCIVFLLSLLVTFLSALQPAILSCNAVFSKCVTQDLIRYYTESPIVFVTTGAAFATGLTLRWLLI